MKKAATIRESTDAELQQQLLDAQSEFVNLKIQQSTGRLELTYSGCATHYCTHQYRNL